MGSSSTSSPIYFAKSMKNLLFFTLLEKLNKIQTIEQTINRMVIENETYSTVTMF